jgi:abequosyltransferase
MDKSKTTLSVAVPSYSRPECLDYLLETISSGTAFPDEIVVCDDNSPNREKIEMVVDKWRPIFAASFTALRFFQNETNLGYDRNLQNLLRKCASDYVVFIGNDDAFTPTGIATIYESIRRNPGIKAFSRSFLKFPDRLERRSGVSRFASHDHIFNAENSKPRMYLRLSAYFGGLVFDRVWASKKETAKYDGSLYYQLYLFASAYYESGIAYISTPTVGARTNGVPLFGAASVEAEFHQSGGYSPASRARMWSEILRISRDTDEKYQAQSAADIRYELKTRLSFHVFEDYSKKSLGQLVALSRELGRLGLMTHPVPVFLFLTTFILRKWSALMFTAVRRLYQR